jgi:hypothetical protein
MTKYFSPSTQWFYNTEFNYPTLPEDIVEISDEDHARLLNAINDYKEAYLDENNHLALQDRPVTISWDSIRTKRNRLLDESDYTQMSDWPGNKTAWAAYRQLLRDIPQTYSTLIEVVWPTKPEN